jgi:hypothetical protein
MGRASVVGRVSFDWWDDFSSAGTSLGSACARHRFSPMSANPQAVVHF